MKPWAPANEMIDECSSSWYMWSRIGVRGCTGGLLGKDLSLQLGDRDNARIHAGTIVGAWMLGGNFNRQWFHGPPALDCHGCFGGINEEPMDQRFRSFSQHSAVVAAHEERRNEESRQLLASH
jgi:hypothetical protein